MAEENTTETTEKKGIKAKGASLWGQIAAAVWIGGWCSAFFIKELSAGHPLNVMTVIISGLAIAACFIPVYFNMFMDKLHDIKIGG